MLFQSSKENGVLCYTENTSLRMTAVIDRKGRKFSLLVFLSLCSHWKPSPSPSLSIVLSHFLFWIAIDLCFPIYLFVTLVSVTDILTAYKGLMIFIGLYFSKPTLISDLKYFNLPYSPLTKGRGGRWLIGQGGYGPV